VAVAAGATFAPLNPAYRESEFDFFLSDMQAKALVVENGKDSPARAVARSRNIPIIELVPDRVREAGTFSLKGPERHRLAQPEYARSEWSAGCARSRPGAIELFAIALGRGFDRLRTQ